jgi:hypothetical protein
LDILLEDGFKVSLNTVARYRQELDLKAVLAVKQVNTTIPIKAHKKYSYKLLCGEDSLSSTNGLRLDKPKLFSFFASHSFSTVTLPTSVVFYTV